MLGVDEDRLSFEIDGAQRYDNAALSTLKEITQITSYLSADLAGIRLHNIPGLRELCEAPGPIGITAASILGPDCRAVRAILFDKTSANNWSLAWHQDRTIAVERRINVEGFGSWTIKAGLQHTEPPFEILANMITLRVHLDDVQLNNAPLLVAPGSHRLGRILDERIRETVSRCGSVACLAKAGDIWVYATTILHASEAAKEPARRRVLQLDYAIGDLPSGLRWLGIG